LKKISVKNEKCTFGWVCAILLSAFLLSSCKSSRRAASSATSDKVKVTFDAGEGAASSASSSPKSTSTVASSGYPAGRYYGDRWNTGHVRLNSDPKPSGAVRLDLTPAGTSAFVMPLCGTILSEFGPRSGRMHTGIDIKLKKEDAVRCAFDGMVRMAKDYGNYGKVVVVRHDNGLETLYSHLNSIAVKLNQRVRAGERIGGGGKTGNARGEHLHFETRFMGEPFNPRLVVNFESCRLNAQTLSLNENSYRKYGKNVQVAATPTPTNKPPEQPTEKQTHRVEKGDTLYNIARRYGTTVEALRKLNRLTESSVIEIGQTLKVKR
jgi:murein DD-endopeptidase MepM/ murein hydrolase activator NlpD